MPFGETRKSYSASFKLEVIRFAEEHGGNRAAQRKYGINEKNIRDWRKAKDVLCLTPKNKRKANRNRRSEKHNDESITMSETGSKLSRVLQKLQEYIPLKLAEDWDNVGLLIQPSHDVTVKSMILTNDLTEAVLTEAVEKKVQLIVSYHPPIFRPIKRLTMNSWKERIVVKCLENGIGVFSPHTALDAVENGVNDWLIKTLGSVSCCEPIHGSRRELLFSHQIIIDVPTFTDAESTLSLLFIKFKEVAFTLVNEKLFLEGDGENLLRIKCCEKDLATLFDYMDSRLMPYVQIVKLEKHPLPHHGMGRMATLNEPKTIGNAVEAIKRYLGLENVRLALGINQNYDSTITTFAVCAGSGSSVLRGVCADLILTGEMSHHDVLDFVHNNVSVVLCDHTNTERGYLTLLQSNLQELFKNDNIDITLAVNDHDPLTIV